MSAKKHLMAFGAAAALLVTWGAQSVLAVEPQLRSFILLLESSTFDDSPDVDATDSLFLVTHSGKTHNPSGTPVRIGFATCDGGSDHHVESFYGTQWYFGGYLSHVTMNGVRTYVVLWQDEIPPNGALAITGPDGMVLLEHYWLRQAATGECDTTNGDWLAEDRPTANSRPFCHGVGLFSK